MRQQPRHFLTHSYDFHNPHILQSPRLALRETQVIVPLGFVEHDFAMFGD
jgi:hypothetical protein